MKDENTLKGLITGYADANISDTVRLDLIRENRIAVQTKLAEVEAELNQIEHSWEREEISLSQLEQHRREGETARRRLSAGLGMLELYIARLERVRG